MCQDIADTTVPLILRYECDTLVLVCVVSVAVHCKQRGWHHVSERVRANIKLTNTHDVAIASLRREAEEERACFRASEQTAAEGGVLWAVTTESDTTEIHSAAHHRPLLDLVKVTQKQ